MEQQYIAVQDLPYGRYLLNAERYDCDNTKAKEPTTFLSSTTLRYPHLVVRNPHTQNKRRSLFRLYVPPPQEYHPSYSTHHCIPPSVERTELVRQPEYDIPQEKVLQIPRMYDVCQGQISYQVPSRDVTPVLQEQKIDYPPRQHHMHDFLLPESLRAFLLKRFGQSISTQYQEYGYSAPPKGVKTRVPSAPIVCCRYTIRMAIPLSTVVYSKDTNPVCWLPALLPLKNTAASIASKINSKQIRCDMIFIVHYLRNNSHGFAQMPFTAFTSPRE